MHNKYSSFQEKRKDIFKTLVQLAYQNQLKEKIDDLPSYFTTDRRESSIIKQEILTAMGLSSRASYDTELATLVDAALEQKKIEEPIVTVNKSICEECQHINRNLCTHNEEEGLLIDSGRCISCGQCIPNCPLEAISDKIEFLPLVNYFQKKVPVYAHVAPAIVGQFGANISMGQLRTALKSIGFTDLVEVALFADILTLREADEYNKLVKTESDFLITSCCCPVWINLLMKHYQELSERMTKTVSPMIASGRFIKAIFPEAITVFIGPCIAKKSEAKVPELLGAIDYVLTFEELAQVFTALEIDLNKIKEEHKEQSSYGGRIYGRTGGVSEAVEITVERINPSRELEFKAIQADGVRECKELLDQLVKGDIQANFVEGMGCEGGCVGGPKRNIAVEKGREQINHYSKLSAADTPIDNLNISYILKYLSGIDEEKSKRIDQLSYDQLLLREYQGE